MAFQEGQQEAVYLVWLLGLNPVAAVGNDVLLNLRHHARHFLDGIGFKGADRVAVTNQEQRRLFDLTACQRLGALPVALKQRRGETIFKT